MSTSLAASTNAISVLFSSNRFSVPLYQRNYSWGKDEVKDFFKDIENSLDHSSYFLGLIILTGKENPKDIVDGQQRLLTLTLLAAALYHAANKYERKSLARNIADTFLTYLDYDTDQRFPRITLSDEIDDKTLLEIIEKPAKDILISNRKSVDQDSDSISKNLVSAYQQLSKLLHESLESNPGKMLPKWATFITQNLYIALFVHPDSGAAYRVFEIVNTRGKELTTADLLKSYVLSNTPEIKRGERYLEWQNIARSFVKPEEFVQFIRHSVTVRRGYVLPRDLYDVLAGHSENKDPISASELIAILQEDLPVYTQIQDPSSVGPTNDLQTAIFEILNHLGISTLRPILIALQRTGNPAEGATAFLRLVVRRVVLGSLGTGNVERRFGEAAKKIFEDRSWEMAFERIEDLNPSESQFTNSIQDRKMSRGLLSLILASISQNTVTPDLSDSYPQFIIPENGNWAEDTDPSEVRNWSGTIGNVILTRQARRISGVTNFEEFARVILPTSISKSTITEFTNIDNWTIEKIRKRGKLLSSEAAKVWYE